MFKPTSTPVVKALLCSSLLKSISNCLALGSFTQKLFWFCLIALLTAKDAFSIAFDISSAELNCII